MTPEHHHPIRIFEVKQPSTGHKITWPFNQRLEGIKISGTHTYPIDRSFDKQVKLSGGPDFGDDGKGRCSQVSEGNGETLFTGGCTKEIKGKYTNEIFSSSWTFSINPDE